MNMRINLFGNKKRTQSCLLVFVIVAASIAIMLPLTAPRAQAVTHMASTSEEDEAGWPWDDTGTGDEVVQWVTTEIHLMNGPYTVESGWTLIIPALNEMISTISIQVPTVNITVESGATLIIETDGAAQPTRTLFEYAPMMGWWDGIYVAPGGEATIQDVVINKAKKAVEFSSGAIVGGNGIQLAQFSDYSECGILMHGAVGNTVIRNSVDFDDSPNFAPAGLIVSNGMLDIIGPVSFIGHGDGGSNIVIDNAEVTIDGSEAVCVFDVNGQAGNAIRVSNNPTLNSTVVRDCNFNDGADGEYYIYCEGASPYLINCSFENETGGTQTITVNDNIGGVPSHAILLCPNRGAPFDTNTIDVTGTSSVCLQWWVHVYVDDPHGNPIPNSEVDISAPSWPDTKLTDDFGWAMYFWVTDRCFLAGNSVIDYNPFNVSAENNTIYGYADPEPVIQMEDYVVFVTVPFNPIPNSLPDVVFITVPVGVQGGLITIEYMVIDLDEAQSGSLSVMVYFSTDGDSWLPATQGGGDFTFNLLNNTVYTFIWESDNEADLANTYNETVYIKIVPYDGYGPGNEGITDPFTVDNKPPVLTLPPVVTVGNDWTQIDWSADESANATVYYGLFVDGSPGDLTNQQTGSVLTMAQSVNLSGLLQGCMYTFVVESTDEIGHSTSSGTYVFETEVHIALYEGWNMISVPPFSWDPDVGAVLATIADDWTAVQTYEAADPDDPWKQNVSGKPFGNDLHWIYAYNGLWILMNKDATLIPDQSIPDPAAPPYVVLLLEGWNFVGYPSAQTRTVDDALTGISYSIVMTYDAATGEWLENDGPGGDPDTFTNMEIGKGYWIYSTDPMEQEWNVPYTD